MLRQTLGVLLASLALFASANEIYKTIDEHGNVLYSDTPPAAGASPMELPNLNIEPGIQTRVRLSPTPAEESTEEVQVWISSPGNEAVIHAGAMNFSVNGAVNRPLEENEHAQLLVNGQVYGDSRRHLSWTVSDLFRGEYRLQIQVSDEDTILAQSDVVTVYVRRAFAR